MHDILAHIHSVLRWFALVWLLLSIFKSFSGLSGNKTFTRGDKKLTLFTLIFMHTQLLIGLWLYAIFVTQPGFSFKASMHDPLARHFSVEHITAMLIAIVLITIGYSKSKKASTDKAKFKSIAVYYTIALVLILAMIPWPFMAKFASYGWY